MLLSGFPTDARLPAHCPPPLLQPYSDMKFCGKISDLLQNKLEFLSCQKEKTGELCPFFLAF